MDAYSSRLTGREETSPRLRIQPFKSMPDNLLSSMDENTLFVIATNAKIIFQDRLKSAARLVQKSFLKEGIGAYCSIAHDSNPNIPINVRFQALGCALNAGSSALEEKFSEAFVSTINRLENSHFDDFLGWMKCHKDQLKVSPSLMTSVYHKIFSFSGTHIIQMMEVLKGLGDAYKSSNEDILFYVTKQSSAAPQSRIKAMDMLCGLSPEKAKSALQLMKNDVSLDPLHQRLVAGILAHFPK